MLFSVKSLIGLLLGYDTSLIFRHDFRRPNLVILWPLERFALLYKFKS